MSSAGKVPDSTVERRALTILHELARMWFGDLVTMKWWDDLWLNESFAEWALTVLPGGGHRVAIRMDHFLHAREGLGLPPGPALLDALQSSPIRDPHDVEVNFDGGITYAKGASVLKQSLRMSAATLRRRPADLFRQACLEQYDAGRSAHRA